MNVRVVRHDGRPAEPGRNPPCGRRPELLIVRLPKLGSHRRRFPMSWNSKAIMLGLGLGVVLAGCQAWAGPPQIGNISPSGVQRGVASEVTISGANLAGNPRLIAPFAFRVEPLDPEAEQRRRTGRSS